MAATVIQLDGRRPEPEPTCRCPQHRMWDLADRVSAALAETQDELLIPSATFAAVLDDVLTTIAQTMRTRSEATW